MLSAALTYMFLLRRASAGDAREAVLRERG